MHDFLFVKILIEKSMKNKHYVIDKLVFSYA